MKRLFLAILILVPAAGLAYAMHSSAMQLRRQANSQEQAWLAERQSLALARTQFNSVTEQVRQLTQKLEAQSVPAGAGLAGQFTRRFLSEHLATADAFSGFARLSPAESEELLAELGFNWGSTGDYIIVSKDTLRALSLGGVRDNKLNQTACDVLAITPDERATLDAAIQSLSDDYNTWAQAHIRRGDPSGNIVAQYTLSADNDFSLSLSNRFAGALTSTLGEQRGSLLMQYSSSWMEQLGMNGGDDTTLTVRLQHGGDDPAYGYEVKQGGGINSSVIAPHQGFPGAFRPLFPNGWTDLAQREGFPLPKSFSNSQ